MSEPSNIPSTPTTSRFAHEDYHLVPVSVDWMRLENGGLLELMVYASQPDAELMALRDWLNTPQGVCFDA